MKILNPESQASFWILKFGLWVCFGFWILSFGFQVWAYPHIFPAPAVNGPSGVVRIPSADVIPYKNFNIGADFGATFLPEFSSTESTVYYKMNLGTFHGVELGVVGGTEKDSGKIREGVFINMKLSLSTGEEPYPLLLAIGVENLFSYTQTDVYMVATKYLKQGPRLTFGFMADFPEDKFRPLGMAGIEIPLAETLFLASDLLAGETLFQVDAGARLYFTPIFSLNFSALNLFDNTDAKDSRAALVGFSWANPF
ncbi:hypothetical protein AMJ44_07480 [candidate division WOR-1 bacterium DG_54_3]|uniref:Uncharacterized protein n=1 Tax=candidate division WOR-1 bacterium DG_54_3 TaxID=1703775 RepID=A0A0S7XXJ2_UNCSA|nr:MAG: hypothetical protein AMJ44_07480 [candidate division WOR-1 bacterium DG_54_3]